MPKASRRKRLTRPPKWTRRPKPKEPVIVPAEATPELEPFPVAACPIAPIAHAAVAITACPEPEEPETLFLPQSHNVPVPVYVPPEDFPSSDSDIPMLKNTDDLIQCLKDHLKKWKEP